MKKILKMKAMFLYMLMFCMFYSCNSESIDNQANLDEETMEVVNPTPVSRNFVKINKQHKILIACVDFGVDYNHPDLMDNIHFTLNEQGEPTGCGWDYTGNDSFPAPYIGRLNIDKENFSYSLLASIIEAKPETQPFLDLRRSAIKEYKHTAMHGDHMSGIITQGRKDFGILPYRYGPVHGVGYDYTTGLMKNIIKATRQAIKDGAKIVNLSSSFSADVTGSDSIKEMISSVGSLTDSAEKKEVDNLIEWKRISDEFEKIVNDNPEVLFLVALGNGNGKLIYSQSDRQVNFGSGIVAPNLLRVGALNDSFGLSDISSIAVDETNAIYVPGEKIASLKPSKMFVPPEAWAKNYLCLIDEINQGNESYVSIGKFLLFWNEKQSIVEADGSSGATALLDHYAASLMLDQGLSAQEIVKKVLASAEVEELNGIKLKKLKIEKPKW